MASPDSLPRGLILQHDGFKALLDGRLLAAPVADSVGRVLDIGTGCGIWAAEFAADHPEATVIGIDVFPQPNIAAPPNCRFLLMDTEQDWDLAGGFDLIHTRLVPFHADAVRAVLRRCYRHLEPGGYMEMQEAWPPCRTDEPAGTPDHQSKVIEWTRLRLEAASKLGINQAITGELPELLSGAGFIAVQSRELQWPIGPWMEDEGMKAAGDLNVELLRQSMQGLSKELLAEIGMGERQVDELLEQVERDLGVGKIYSPVRIVWARKPGHEGTSSADLGTSLVAVVACKEGLAVFA